MAKICLGCLNPLPEEDDACRICGFSLTDQNVDYALKVGTVLQEHYTVGRMVHEGSDSLFYLGYDETLKEPCFIQEYRPTTLCQRDISGQINPLGGCERNYEEYKQEFRSTVRALARVKDLPNMIPIYDIFEENGTCYAISDYCEGETLTKKIARAGGRIPWQEARPMFMSLITCAEQLASAHIHHLAICPDNILISEDGKPHLRGFSITAARQVGNDLQPHLATGYAAPEQYDMDGVVGEMTDVYGIAATIFRTVTGNEPPAGNDRADDSDDLFMSAEIADELTQQVCIALFNALQVSSDNRTASIAKFHQQLSMEPNVSALIDEDSAAKPPKKSINKQLRTALVIFGSVLATALVVIMIVVLSLGDRTQGDASSDPEVSLPEFTTTTNTTKKSVKYAVPNLVGKNYADVRDDKAYKNFIIQIQHKEYSEKEAGVILSQEPEEGTSVDKGSSISIVVSLGKDDNVAVPELSGWKEEQAKLYLEALGFEVEIAELYATDIEKGYVESTDPAAGTIKKVGDTITLRVSYVEQPEESSTPESEPDASNEVSDDESSEEGSSSEPIPEEQLPPDGNTVEGDNLS